MKILVVDDDRSIRFVIKNIFTSKGHNVIEASSGEEGVDFAYDYFPDLILLDIVMPGIGGLQACHEIKLSRKMQETPVFMISGLSQLTEIGRAYAAGADDYITKPLDLANVYDELMRMFERFQNKLSKKASMFSS